MNLLLSQMSKTESIVIAIVLISVLIIGVLIAVTLKNRFNKEAEMLTKREPKNIAVSTNKQYLTRKELEFLHTLYKVIPDEFVAFPKVGLSQLLIASNDKLAKSLLATEFVDMCVFTKDTLEPVLVIDLVEIEVSTNTFAVMSPVVAKALKIAKLPILKVNVGNAYDPLQLKKDIITNMPDKIVAMLKKNIIDGK